MARSLVLEEMLSLADKLPMSDVPAVVERLDAAERLYFYGVGRCGLVLKMFAMRLMHLGHTCHMVGDVTTPAVSPRDLLIVASGSSTTGTVVQVCQTAKQLGTDVLLFTNNLSAPLVQQVGKVIHIPGVHKHAETLVSQQATGSLFEQMLFCFFEEIVYYCMQIYQLEPKAFMQRHANLE